MKVLRRLLAITLLAVISLPFTSSLLASTSKGEKNLPACCLRGGKHHCMAGFDSSLESTGNISRFQAPADKCPYYLGLATLANFSFALPVSDAIFAELLSHPAVAPQTQSKWRITCDRCRQKRGPPISLI